jgi:hypothetical protein
LNGGVCEVQVIQLDGYLVRGMSVPACTVLLSDDLRAGMGYERRIVGAQRERPG